jgi:hypothetical protein
MLFSLIFNKYIYLYYRRSRSQLPSSLMEINLNLANLIIVGLIHLGIIQTVTFAKNSRCFKFRKCNT